MKNININEAYSYAKYINKLSKHIEVNTVHLPGCPDILPIEYDTLIHHVQLAINRLHSINYDMYDILSLKIYIYSYILVPIINGKLVCASLMNDYKHLVDHQALTKDDLKSFISSINI